MIFDISPTLDEAIAVFPGDTAFSRKMALDFAAGDHLALSSMQATLHLGAHTDAPNHYHPDGCDIAARDLSFYLGPAQVVHLNLPPERERILPADLDQVEISAPRVLFGTGSFPNPYQWTDTFQALSPELISFLAGKGVRLVGIDTPSIDPAASVKLESHAMVYRHDMAILEGIVLHDVPAGSYHLVALPLKIRGGDAAPVRAVLLSLDHLQGAE